MTIIAFIIFFGVVLLVPAIFIWAALGTSSKPLPSRPTDEELRAQSHAQPWL